MPTNIIICNPDTNKCKCRFWTANFSSSEKAPSSPTSMAFKNIKLFFKIFLRWLYKESFQTPPGILELILQFFRTHAFDHLPMFQNAVIKTALYPCWIGETLSHLPQHPQRKIQEFIIMDEVASVSFFSVNFW